MRPTSRHLREPAPSVMPVEEPTVAGRDEPLPRDVLLLRPRGERRGATRAVGVTASLRVERVVRVLERGEPRRRAAPLRPDESCADREVGVHRPGSARRAKWNLPVRKLRESLKTS